ncbi:alpha/beta hydrolase [Amylibacter marinus]|uniref:Alpha/beta hydrolase n=1 Tax=Amylibacter marinus TaxID=1475483 RepID=A0ABQ5VR84_9RHOB|nr:alpha/beta hydrolase [Amylibacter marinus]GLQ33927.1 alpha/beta hydrolase [Amylibacter marinus]
MLTKPDGKVTAQPGMKFSHNYVRGLSFQGFHRIHYTDWNNRPDIQDQDTLVCVHGVSRNGRDFDYLAERMMDQYRVVCPDMVGRGESDHLLTHKGYDYLQYNADMNAVLARLDVGKVDWVGTSMGGIIGMVFASLPQSPIKKLVLVDVGPEISRDSLLKIGEYIGLAGEFKTREALKEYMREIYKDFYPLSEDDLDHMFEHAAVRTKQGKFKLRMDPAIGDAFREDISLFDVDMWETWDNISCPVLIVRGKESQFFSQETAKEMLTRGPETTLIEMEHAGHTPTLRNDEQVDPIRKWLLEN